MTSRILVADDNALNVKLLSARLGREYYSVLTASNGQEAINAAKEHQPDLILLDVMMPGMDGYTACEHLRRDKTTQHIPIIMVTALSEAADRIRGLQAGADDYLTKPIDDNVLLARVRSLLRLKLVMDEWRTRVDTSQALGTSMTPDMADVDISKGHVFLYSDDKHEVDQVTQSLAGVNVTVKSFDHLVGFKQHALAQACDVMMIGLDQNPDEVLRLCPFLRSQETTRHTPILLIASATDTQVLTRSLDLGTSDYIFRPIEVNELVARTKTQLKQKRYYERLKAFYQDSVKFSLIDSLTGVFNRRYFDGHLPVLMERCGSAQKPVSLLMIDLDHFKSVNDTHGHAGGDEVLKRAAQTIVQSVRAMDCVSRLGGEEFGVILPETNLQIAHIVAERVRERMQGQPIVLPGHRDPIKITCSIGVAEYKAGSAETVESLIERADAALYDAKNQGRNIITLAKPAA
ncbi:MAG: PleD family two-component system response regulator [Alphaproteobacteria bacterium]|nr:PleD family two-component system response regulator [Alphaproteobacteria bacterium]NDG04647.1 PleD family two-component system response regulator [Alphaproteobacteria bacterium]